MNRHNRLWVILVVVAALAALGARTSVSAQAGRAALVLTLDGPLTPALGGYIQNGVARAEREGMALVILKLNTPGGQINLMEDIVEVIRNSRVPVVVFVTPRSAIAGSAGTLITLAGHAAAMSPETAIGAASPVGGQGENLESTLERKEKEAMRALVRTLTTRRRPEAVALAEATIESAKAVTADEALEAGLVDFIAADVPDLLRQLDGFEVEVNGQPQTLATQDLALTEQSLNLLEAVLNLLTNPNVVFTLTSLGSLLIWVEVSSPGGWVAGFLGVVCMMLAFYGLGVLPVNWFGIIFIIVAFVLFIMDIYATSHGALTVAASASLIVGALVLFNSSGTPAYFRVNVPLVVIMSLAIAGISLGILTIGLRAQRAPAAMGMGTLVGQVGEARSPNSVQVAGELWTAEAVEGQLEAGEKVEVAAVKGLKLVVRKKKAGE
ncbi:MAG: putative rane protein [Anaerolineales bacterium]|nr:putative rane protein [Anaerolineales bacterium]